jgi:NADH:ubiquinone oxidoreductase subunit 4 (subunit M)
MGIVGLGLSTVTAEGLNGAVFQMFAHGIMTALLFSSLGYIYDKTHTKLIPDLGGMSRVMPVALGYFIVAACTNWVRRMFVASWNGMSKVPMPRPMEPSGFSMQDA